MSGLLNVGLGTMHPEKGFTQEMTVFKESKLDAKDRSDAERLLTGEIKELDRFEQELQQAVTQVLAEEVNTVEESSSALQEEELAMSSTALLSTAMIINDLDIINNSVDEIQSDDLVQMTNVIDLLSAQPESSHDELEQKIHLAVTSAQVERGVKAYDQQQEQRTINKGATAKELLVESALHTSDEQPSESLLLENLKPKDEVKLMEQSPKAVINANERVTARNASIVQNSQEVAQPMVQEQDNRQSVLIVNNLKDQAQSLPSENLSSRAQEAKAVQSMLFESGNTEIVKRAQFVLRGDQPSEIRLTLRPEHLGAVRVHLNVEDGRILGRIVVANEAVKDAFAENMSDLRDAFLKSGFDASFDLNHQGQDDSEQAKNASKYYSRRLQAEDESSAGVGDILAYWQQGGRGVL